MFRGGGGRGGGGFKKPAGGRGRGGGGGASDQSLTSCIPPDIDWYAEHPPLGYVPGRDRGDPGFSTSAELRTTVDPEKQRQEVEARERERERRRRQELRERQERDRDFIQYAGVTADGESALPDDDAAAQGRQQQQQREQDPSTRYVLPDGSLAGSGSGVADVDAETAAALLQIGLPAVPKVRVEAGQARAEQRKARQDELLELQQNIVPVAAAAALAGPAASSIRGAAATKQMELIVRGVASVGREGEAVNGADASGGASGVEYTMLAGMGAHDPAEVERYRQLVLRRIATCDAGADARRTRAVEPCGGVDAHFMRLAQVDIIEAGGDLSAGYRTILRGLHEAGPCPHSGMLWTAAVLFARNIMLDAAGARRHSRHALQLLAGLAGTPDLPDPADRKFAAVQALVDLAVELERPAEDGGGGRAEEGEVERQQRLDVLRNAVLVSPHSDALWEQLFALEPPETHRGILGGVMSLLSGAAVPLSMWTRLAEMEQLEAAASAGAPTAYDRAIKVVVEGIALHPAAPQLWLRRAVLAALQHLQRSAGGSVVDCMRSHLRDGLAAAVTTVSSPPSAESLRQLAESWLRVAVKLAASCSADPRVRPAALFEASLCELLQTLSNNSAAAVLCDTILAVVDGGDHAAATEASVLRALVVSALGCLSSRVLHEESLPLASLFALLAGQRFTNGDAASSQKASPASLSASDDAAVARAVLSNALTSMFPQPVKAEAVATGDAAGDDGSACEERRYRMFLACCGMMLDFFRGARGLSHDAACAECIGVLQACFAPRGWIDIAVGAFESQRRILLLGAPTSSPPPFNPAAVIVEGASSLHVIAHGILAQAASRCAVAATSNGGGAALAAELSALERIAAERVIFRPETAAGLSEAVKSALMARAAALRTRLLSSIRLLRHVTDGNNNGSAGAARILSWDDLAGVDTTLDCRLRLHAAFTSNRGAAFAKSQLEDQIRATQESLAASIATRDALLKRQQQQQPNAAAQQQLQTQLQASGAHIQRRTDALCHLIAARIRCETGGTAAERMRVADRFFSAAAPWFSGAVASFSVSAPAAASSPSSAHVEDHVPLCTLDPVAGVFRLLAATPLLRVDTATLPVAPGGSDCVLFPVAVAEFDGKPRALPGLDLLLSTFVECVPAVGRQRAERLKEVNKLAKPITSAARAAFATPPLPRFLQTASQLFAASAGEKTTAEDKADCERLAAQEMQKSRTAARAMFRGSTTGTLPAVFQRSAFDFEA